MSLSIIIVVMVTKIESLLLTFKVVQYTYAHKYV